MQRAILSAIAAWITWAFIGSVDPAEALDQTHSLSPSYHATIIQSESDNTYTFHSPGITYNTFLGKALGSRSFALGFRGRAAIFFPTELFQDGRFFHARDYYAFTQGGEALLGAAYTAKIPSGEVVVVDLGAHFNGLKLGSEIYQSLYSLTFGVGASVEYLYPLNRLWTIGAFAGVAGHFLDFIHETNKLKFGVTVTAGIAVGFRSFKKKRSKP